VSGDFTESDELFALYQLAELMHKTVQELLTGAPAPLDIAELRMWSTYFRVKQVYIDKEQASRNSSRGR
jgi:hypothetical protein